MPLFGATKYDAAAPPTFEGITQRALDFRQDMFANVIRRGGAGFPQLNEPPPELTPYEPSGMDLPPLYEEPQYQAPSYEDLMGDFDPRTLTAGFGFNLPGEGRRTYEGGREYDPSTTIGELGYQPGAFRPIDEAALEDQIRYGGTRDEGGALITPYLGINAALGNLAAPVRDIGERLGLPEPAIRAGETATYFAGTPLRAAAPLIAGSVGGGYAAEEVAPDNSIARFIGENVGQVGAVLATRGAAGGLGAIRSGFADEASRARAKSVPDEFVSAVRDTPDLQARLNAASQTPEDMRNFLDAAGWASSGTRSRVQSRFEDLRRVTMEQITGQETMTPSTAARGEYERALEATGDPNAARRAARNAAAQQQLSNDADLVASMGEQGIARLERIDEALTTGAPIPTQVDFDYARQAALERFFNPEAVAERERPTAPPLPEPPLMLPEGRRPEPPAPGSIMEGPMMTAYHEGGQPYQRPAFTMQSVIDEVEGIDPTRSFADMNADIDAILARMEGSGERAFQQKQGGGVATAVGAPEEATNVGRAIQLWEQTERDISSTIKDPQGISRALNAMRAAVTGELNDPYLTRMVQRREQLIGMIQQADPSMEYQAARTLADQTIQKQLADKYGDARLSAEAEAKIAALDARAEGVSGQIGPIKMANERLKNSQFGLDFAIGGTDIAPAIRYGGLQIVAGLVNSVLERLGSPGARARMMAGPGLNDTLVAMNDGLGVGRNRSLETAGLQVGKKGPGTILRYGGAVTKEADDLVSSINETLTRVQYDTILGGLRKLMHEGNLAMLDWMKVDVSNPATRATSARTMNNATNWAETAIQPGRKELERLATTSPSRTRAQVNRLLDVSKTIRPDATPAERIIGASLVLNNAIYMLAYGQLVNEAVGIAGFETDPRKPGFAQVMLPTTDKDGRHNKISIFGQGSLDRAIVSSYEAIKNEDPDTLAETWAKWASGRSNYIVRAPAAYVGGFGYGEDGKFYVGGMPTEDRIKTLYPGPMSLREVTDPIIFGGESRANPETIAIQGSGFSEFPETAFQERDRLFSKAWQGITEREDVPEILKLEWAKAGAYDELAPKEKRVLRESLGPDWQRRYDADVAGLDENDKSRAMDAYFAVSGPTAQASRDNKAKWLDQLEKDLPQLGAAVREELFGTEIQQAIAAYYNVPFNQRQAWLNELTKELPGLAARIAWNVSQ